jgi:hypothetical protein
MIQAVYALPGWLSCRPADPACRAAGRSLALALAWLVIDSAW